MLPDAKSWLQAVHVLGAMNKELNKTHKQSNKRMKQWKHRFFERKVPSTEWEWAWAGDPKDLIAIFFRDFIKLKKIGDTPRYP